MCDAWQRDASAYFVEPELKGGRTMPVEIWRAAIFDGQRCLGAKECLGEEIARIEAERMLSKQPAGSCLPFVAPTGRYVGAVQ